MISQEAAIFLFLIGFTLLGTSLLFFVSRYRRFYTWIKANHHDEWQRLMNKDPFIETMGAWIRYPFGSVYLVGESLRMRQQELDETISTLKKRIRLALAGAPIGFLICIISLVLKEM